MSGLNDGPLVEAERLSFRFQGSDRCALRDLSLTIARGEFVVVTGPSGCGKSTLALALGGYLSPRGQHRGELSGRLRVAGLDVRDCPVYDLAEVVGLVQQNPEAQFCTLTVDDEVAFGLENRCRPPAEIRERLAWALGVVGAGHLAGRELAGLSGGEKQKVAIAAVLAARPALLILDEPTSNLDPAATADVFAAIARIRAEAGLTVIVVEHKVRYLEGFRPRLVAMADGQVVADGPAAAWRPAALPGRPANRPPAVADNGRPPAVRVERASLGYGRAPAVCDLTVRIEPGEFVAVMGDNGSGKTTFLLSLLGLIKPLEGQVDVLGHDTRHTPVSRLARHVGLVFQNPDHQLFAENVWREATLAPSNLGLLDTAAEARTRDLLGRAGLGGREADHPFRLSYGEKRRLNLVSVLGHAPRLLLLDEVLIGQDAANAAWLLELAWRQAGQGAAVVMVNHDPEVTRRYATRLLFFDGGRVAVDAPVDAAFRQLAALGRRAYLPAGEAAA